MALPFSLCVHICAGQGKVEKKFFFLLTSTCASILARKTKVGNILLCRMLPTFRVFGTACCLPSLTHEHEVHGKEYGYDPGTDIHLAPFAREQLDQGVGDKGKAYAVGYAVGEGHHDNSQKGRKALCEIGEIDVYHVRHHEGAHDDECRGSGTGRDEANQGRKEEGEGKERSHSDGSEAGSAALGDAGGAFHVAGNGGRSHKGACHCAQGVRGKGLAEVVDVPVLAHEACLFRKADERSHVVEKGDNGEGDHNGEHAVVHGSDDVEAHEDLSHAWQIKAHEAVQPLGQGCDTGNHGKGRGGKHAQDHGSLHAAYHEGHSEQEPEAAKKRFGVREASQGDQGVWVVDHNAAVFEANEGNEGAYAYDDGELQVEGDGVYELFAQPCDGEQKEDDRKVKI